MIPISAPQIGERERQAAHRVLASGALVQGEEVARFEAGFSQLVDGRICVAVSSGTSALHLSLVALGVGSGDEVIVPSFTFAATANAVRLTGATPVFVDIDPATYCIDPSAVEAAVTSRTVAIIPVHLFGHVADMAAINATAERFGLAVLEDACQAHAARLHGHPAGSLGDVAAFSFYATKNMTTGEGGMVVCRDEGTARSVRLLRNQGMEHRYANEVVGYNARMTEVAAAIGQVQLERLEDFTAQRRQNAEHLRGGLQFVSTPITRSGVDHAYHQFTIRWPDRDALLNQLRQSGIGAGVYYPTPVHELPAYGLDLDLPETKRAASEVLSLPVHPGLARADLERIVESVNSTINEMELVP